LTTRGWPGLTPGSSPSGEITNMLNQTQRKIIALIEKQADGAKLNAPNSNTAFKACAAIGDLGRALDAVTNATRESA
jgi:hypothetical protein